MGSRLGKLAEISIPQPVNSSDVTKLPRATFLQGFFDPAEGRLSGFPGTGIAVDGVLVYGDRLYGTASVYYDANNEQRVSHFSRSLTLSQASFRGWSAVWSPDKSGFVSGYMALVPQEWQTALGGPAITGQFGTPIVWRTSWGPAAFAFNPTLIGNALVPASPLLYYNSEHQTLGPWSSSNPTYGATTDKGGVAIIAGSRSLLFFGRNGVGPYCYGNGTSDQLLVGKIGSDGAHWCYDPTNAAKGPHAYPYRYQIWAYDVNELAKVKRGEKSPWDVRPYGVWPFDLPTPEPSVRIAGIGYDSATQTIYLTQMRGEKDGYANRPVVHVLRVGGVGGSPLPTPSDTSTPDYGSSDPTPPPPPAPSGTSSKVSSVTITANRTSPQPPGTAVTLTAVPNGGATPQQYKWWRHDGTRWVELTSWSTSNTYAWTPTATGAYRFGVWVRSAGATADAAEANVNFDFQISGTATSSPAPRVSSVGIAANRSAPQPPGTPVTFTAVPIGGATPVQLKWRVFNGTSWTTPQSWSTVTTYTWTPSSANSGYRIEVSARSAGVTADTAEAVTTMDFPIVNSTTTSPTPSTAPPPVTSSTVTSVVMTASKAPPQRPGTTITFSAIPTGGIAPHQYEWWVFDGTWRMVRGWSTSNTYSWTPTVASSSYKVNVKVRSANKTSNIEEAKGSMDFAISSTQPPSTAPPPTTAAARATAVTLTSNRTSPQVRGTAITWTASNVAGGVAPFQYKFHVWNGAGWVVVRGWSTSNTFTWVPTLANPYYKVAVWVRSAGNNSDDYEASATSGNFAIQ